MEKKITSPKYNWKGFKISKNLADSLKQCIYILVPAVILEITTKNPTYAAIAGIVGKVIFSAVEYWIKERTE